jgi:hypothetical protein
MSEKHPLMELRFNRRWDDARRKQVLAVGHFIGDLYCFGCPFRKGKRAHLTKVAAFFGVCVALSNITH